MGAEKPLPLFSQSNGTRPEEGNHYKNSFSYRFVDVTKQDLAADFNMGSISINFANATVIDANTRIIDRFYSFQTSKTAVPYYERMRMTVVLKRTFATFWTVGMIKTSQGNYPVSSDGTVARVCDIYYCADGSENPTNANTLQKAFDYPLDTNQNAIGLSFSDAVVGNQGRLFMMFRNFVPKQEEFANNGKFMYTRNLYYIPSDKRFMFAGWLYKRTDREAPSYLQLGNINGMPKKYPVEDASTGSSLQFIFAIAKNNPNNELIAKFLEMYKMALQTNDVYPSYVNAFGSELLNSWDFFEKNTFEESSLMYDFIDTVKAIDWALFGGVASEFSQPEKWIIAEAV